MRMSEEAIQNCPLWEGVCTSVISPLGGVECTIMKRTRHGPGGADTTI